MTAPAYVPDAGDLIWTDFDPTKGREQAGRRPALVGSPTVFTENTGLAIVCRLRRASGLFRRAWCCRRVCRFPARSLSHIRSIDAQARPVCYAGASLPAAVARFVRAKLHTFITI
jgi:mRNA interferase MazF